MHSNDEPRKRSRERVMSRVSPLTFFQILFAFILVLIARDAPSAVRTVLSGSDPVEASRELQDAWITLVVVPIQAYLTYFVLAGRKGIQSAIATGLVFLTGITAVIYLIHAFSYRLPGGYLDFELIVAALATMLLQGMLVAGVALRRKKLAQIKEL